MTYTNYMTMIEILDQMQADGILINAAMEFGEFEVIPVYDIDGYYTSVSDLLHDRTNIADALREAIQDGNDYVWSSGSVYNVDYWKTGDDMLFNEDARDVLEQLDVSDLVVYAKENM